MDSETVCEWMRTAAASIHDQRDFLTQLDAAIGDADHGTNMDRGYAAMVETLPEGAALPPPGQILRDVGNTLLLTVGGASGPLWGSALLRAGEALGDVNEFDCVRLAHALEEALAGVVQLGAAEEGDKTMVDALAPASRALREQARVGASTSVALAATRAACETGMRATVTLRATKGRASYLGERSIGHQDPGATSTAIILAALETAAVTAAVGSQPAPPAGGMVSA
jgi:dihydroxyacetone kinase-like protein